MNYGLDDYQGQIDSGLFETDLSAALVTQIDAIDLSFGYTLFEYDGPYYEQEVALRATVNDLRFTPYVEHRVGLGGGTEGNRRLVFGGGSEVFGIQVGGVLSYLDSKTVRGFSHYRIDLAKELDIGSNLVGGAAASYYGQIDDDVLPDGGYGMYDVQVVGSLYLKLAL
jgi:hypothetical protein